MSVESYETYRPWETSTHPLSAQVAANLLNEHVEDVSPQSVEAVSPEQQSSQVQQTELYFVAGRYQDASGEVWTYKRFKTAKTLGQVSVTYPDEQ